MTSNCILTIVCPDRKGIVAAVSRFLFELDCNIIESTQFGDTQTKTFFLRILFSIGEASRVDTLRQDFVPIAKTFSMDANFHDESAKTRTLIMVSRFGHCLVDLLFRWTIGALPIEVVGVVSNHRDFENVAAAYGTPFHYLPVDKVSKENQERALAALVDAEDVDLIVLARYMQVLSSEFCGKMPGRLINIHHSFLPSFKGARPYHQAHQRGVKLIGATAHYVTEALDEGPIIEQGVERVTHALSPMDLAAIGRDVETVVLARAVRWRAEHRVLLNGQRTVVLS